VRPSLPRRRQHSQCRPQDHSQWRRRRRCLLDRCPRQCSCSTRLPSATTATKGTQAYEGSGDSLGGGRLRLRCRGMRSRLARWPIVPIHGCVQGCAWCLPRRPYANSAGTMVGEVCSSLLPAGTHCLAPQLSISDHREDVSVDLHRDCF
jgi:hypothetical protein